jgi:hypothetical protein
MPKKYGLQKMTITWRAYLHHVRLNQQLPQLVLPGRNMPACPPSREARWLAAMRHRETRQQGRHYTHERVHAEQNAARSHAVSGMQTVAAICLCRCLAHSQTCMRCTSGHTQSRQSHPNYAMHGSHCFHRHDWRKIGATSAARLRCTHRDCCSRSSL